jgi:DNA end-binding protein Ku
MSGAYNAAARSCELEGILAPFPGFDSGRDLQRRRTGRGNFAEPDSQAFRQARQLHQDGEGHRPHRERRHRQRLEPHEIEALKVESKKTLDLQQFIDVSEIDPRYFEKPYYIVPADAHAAEGYLVIRDALRGMKKLGVGQITMSGREHIVAVGPVETGLVMEVLRYQEELRPAKPYFSDLPSLKLDEEMVGLARELIYRKAAPFEPGRFHDSYAEAMRQLIEEKAKGKRIVARPSTAAPEGKVVDLLEALRKSLKSGGEGAAPKKQEKRSRSPQKKAS